MSNTYVRNFISIFILFFLFNGIIALPEKFLNLLLNQPSNLKTYFFIFVLILTLTSLININKVVNSVANFLKKYRNSLLLKKLKFFDNNINIFSFSFCMIFLISAYNISTIDIINVGFDKKNTGISYLLWRFLFTLSSSIGIISVGRHLLNFFINTNTRLYLNSFKLFILSFSYGLVLFSFLGIILGFLGLLNSFICLTIMGLILLFSGQIFFLNSYNINLKNSNSNFFEMKNFSFNITLLILISSIFTFFIFKGLLPFETDGDVWGHYMHHYKIVEENSKIIANDLWYHFHLSKGAGLFYFFISLSDLLAPQLVSALCIVLVSIIIMEIVYNLTQDKIWSMVAAVLFLSSLTIISPVSLFKHHSFFMFLIVIMFWCLNELIHSNKNNKIFFLLLMVTVLHIGFFYPTISLIICIFLVISSMFIYFFDKSKLNFFLYSIFILIIGVAVSLILNFYFTGIFEAVKTELFWKFANKTFFINKYGFSPIEYNLIANDGLLDRLKFSKWLNTFIKKHSWPFILSSSMIFFLILSFFTTLNKRNYKNLNFFIILFLIFNVVVFLFAFLIQQPSVVRIYIFINAFVYLPLCILVPIFFKFTGKSNFYILSNHSLAILIACPSFFSIFIAHDHYSNVVKYSRVFKSHYFKNETLAETYKTTIFNKDRRRFYNFSREIRQKYPKEKIYLLSSSGGPGSFLPTPGFIGEPQISLGKEWDLINSSHDIEYIKSTIQKKGINYFVIDISKELWGNVVISKIFNNENLLNHFKILKKNKNFFFLTWKVNEKDRIKDKKFINLIELKRSTIINAIFSKNFKNNFFKNGLNSNSFYKELNYKKEFCLKSIDNKILIERIIHRTIQTDHKIKNIEEKIKNIREVTKSMLVEKFGGFYSLDLDISELGPHHKIYLKKMRSNKCKLIFNRNPSQFFVLT